jgi:ATP-dependent exoDNAse (exonuclease V) alpha subunit
MSINEMTTETIRQAYGAHSPEVIKALLVMGHGGLLHADGKVTTQAALDREQALIKKIDAGVGAHPALGFLPSIKLTGLGAEQKSAVRQIFASRDAVTVLRGKAGTGKTHTLATTIEGLSRSGQTVACFAPSTHAVALLQRDGAEQQAGYTFAARTLAQTSTVQRLLVDPKLQAVIAGKVVIVDEYGLLSIRQLQELVDVAATRRARLLLVGDSGQHKSVEAGDAARIIEKETRVRVAELREVRRQAANPAYRAAAKALAAGRLLEALGKLDQMGAVIEIDNSTARRVRMVEEWHAAAQETKVVRTKAGAQERAKTSLMVAPTWAEIDALNAHAREKLRKEGKISGEEKTFASLRAKDWTKAQQKDVRNYQPGDILVAHKATKHFAKGDELRVIRQEQRRLVVACHGQEVSVSPRQSGLAWTVCEERPLAIAAGDQMRLRAVAQVCSTAGRSQRLANGTTVTVKNVDAFGQLILADGSTLRTRQVVHGYALTSHAAQGLTVDKVFVAGAISREGLYVSATRGREGIRIFVPDRAAFLTAVGLRSEARISATEFARQHRIQTGLRATLARGWRHWQWMRAAVFERITPRSQPELPAEAVSARESAAESSRLKPRIPASVFISGQGPADDSPSPTPAPGPRMRV